MTFITLAESKITTKGNIVVTVTKIGDLKAGSSSSKDWTRKDITVQDGSGAESMSVWNNDIEKFVINHKYELTGIYWKLNNGKQYLNFGQYTQMRDCGISSEENQATMDDTSDQAPSSTDFLKQKQEEIKNREKTNKEKSPLTPEQIGFILEKAVIMYFIRKEIETKISEFEDKPNGGMIWEMTEIIYQDFKEKYSK